MTTIVKMHIPYTWEMWKVGSVKCVVEPISIDYYTLNQKLKQFEKGVPYVVIYHSRIRLIDKNDFVLVILMCSEITIGNERNMDAKK